MKKAIIIGNGPNWNYVDFSNINNLIEKRVNKIINKLKSVDKQYTETICYYLNEINFSSTNFEKCIENLDRVMDLELKNKIPEFLINWESDNVKHGTLSLKEKDKYLENSNNGKIIMEMTKWISEHHLTTLKTIFQISVLQSIFIDLKIGSIKYSNNFKEFLKSFEGIFTTNYDINIEKMGIKNITHLHGKIDNKFFSSTDMKFEENINKTWNSKNKKVLNELIKEEYSSSSSLIESSSKRKNDVLVLLNEVSDISNNIYSYTGREWNCENNYPKLLEYDEIYIYGIGIENDEWLINFLKKNKKKVFYFFRNPKEQSEAIKIGIEDIPNPKINFD